MKKRKRLIYANNYRGYEYFIEESKGTYFGYVLITPKQHGYKYSKPYQRSAINCYGGITSDSYDSKSNRLIGFNTSHGSSHLKNNQEYKWTLNQLQFQCKSIINQIKEVYTK